jgi:uncharacterized membrane protein
VTLVASVLASRSARARYVGRAAVGVLFVLGGALVHVINLGVIGFYLALWLFGWFETGWSLVMLPAMVALLRAERRAGTAPVSKAQPARGQRADSAR